MAVIIDKPNPLAVALGIASNMGVEQENKRRYRDTLASDQAARDFQAKQAAQTQSNSDRQFGLQQKEADANIAHTQQQDKIAQAAADYDAQMRPLLMRAQELANKQAAGAVLSEADTHKLVALQAAKAQIELGIAKKYGAVEAQTAIAQAQANLKQTLAQTGLTQAETANTQKSTALLGTTGGGFGGFGGGGRRPSATTLDDEAQQMMDELPEPVQALLEQVTSGQTNALMLRKYLSGNPHLRQYLPQVEAILTRHSVVPRARAGDVKQTTADDAAARGEETPADARGAAARFKLVSQAKTFRALSPRLQAMVQHVMVDQGLDLQTAADQLRPIAGGQSPPPNGMTQQDAQSILQALGG